MEKYFEQDKEPQDFLIDTDTESVDKLWNWSPDETIYLHKASTDDSPLEDISLNFPDDIDNIGVDNDTVESSDIDDLFSSGESDDAKATDASKGEVPTDFSDLVDVTDFDDSTVAFEDSQEIDGSGFIEAVDRHDTAESSNIDDVFSSRVTDVSEGTDPWLQNLSEDAVLVKATDVDMNFARGINSEYFREKHSNNKEVYMRLAERIPDVRQALNEGRSFEDLRQDPELQYSFAAYFDNESKQKIEVVQDGDGKYHFLANGRHRLLAAQELGHEIPVYVANKLEQSDTVARSEINDGTNAQFPSEVSDDFNAIEPFEQLAEEDIQNQGMDELTELLEERHYSEEELTTFFNEAHEKLSPEQLEALTKYSTNEYYSFINCSLRETPLPKGLEGKTPPPDLDNVINNIQSALDQMNTPQDMIVYRGTDEAPFKDMLKKNLFSGKYDWKSLEGKVYRDSAFLSTSLSENTAEDFARKNSGKYNVLWEVNVPKGTRGGMLNDLSAYSYERELLLGRDEELLITDVSKTKRKIYGKLEEFILVKADLLSREKNR